MKAPARRSEVRRHPPSRDGQGQALGRWHRAVGDVRIMFAGLVTCATAASDRSGGIGRARAIILPESRLALGGTSAKRGECSLA